MAGAVTIHTRSMMFEATKCAPKPMPEAVSRHSNTLGGGGQGVGGLKK